MSNKNKLIHEGSSTLADVLPGLNEAALNLSQTIDELTTTHDEYGRKVNAWDAQKKALQSKLDEAEDLVNTLQGKVHELDSLLTTARDLVTDTLDNLGLSGYHRYGYTGSVGNFSSEIEHFERGLQATTGWSSAGQMYAVLVLLGIPGDPANKAEEIAAMAKSFAMDWEIPEQP